MKMKSEYQLERERKKKKQEKINWAIGWFIISLIMVGGICFLTWINSL